MHDDNWVKNLWSKIGICLVMFIAACFVVILAVLTYVLFVNFLALT